MSASNHSAQAAHSPSRQVLTFALGQEAYGVDILCVKEIRRWSPVTPIPQSPGHVLGVLNLRGSIVPLIDLRRRFGLDRADFTPLTVVIVLSVQMSDGPREFGVVVDSVADVIEVPVGGLQPVPDFQHSAHSDYIEGLATIDDRMLILLDVEELVGRELSCEPATTP